MQRKVIYGPPGTGKTTYLMNLLEQELKQHRPDEIAFVSFTRKGVYEGVDRAKEKFNLRNEELPYFKTLHSICFTAMGFNRLDVINKRHYKLLSTTTGINFTGYYTEDFTSTNDQYLHVASMEQHNPRLARRLLNQLNAKRFSYIKFQYAAMKQQLGIVDFDDILQQYLLKGESLDIKVAFIDEAQDLTQLQWLIVRKMFSKVEKLYVAGDDDQAVYEWSGADVRTFLNFSSDAVILNKSYRMPERILKLSKRVTRDIAKRQAKEFKSSGDLGAIETASKLANVNLEGGELVLARTNWLLRQLMLPLFAKGLIFKFKGKLSVDKTVLRAISAYEKFCRNEDSDLHKHTFHFNEISGGKPWQEIIKLPDHEIGYYEKVLAENATSRQPILLETFHSCKGSENDHVILSSDLTKQVHENFYNDRDAELRCLYVGLTRAKRKLTLLTTDAKERYPEKYFN